MGRSLDPSSWRWRISAAAYSSKLLRRRSSHGFFHSPGQSGVSRFGREFNQRTHRGNLILVLVHSPVEGAAVFRTDQRLRRTNTLGDVGHIELVSIDRIVKVAAPLFFNTETVNTLGATTSEGL